MENITLANGVSMPAIGLGLWKLSPAEVPAVVESAIEMGYRHLDSACDYGNEAEVGVGIEQAIRKGFCKREDLWITSKLWNTYHRREHVRPALERTLRDLRTDYLDLYLIHFPIALEYVPHATRYPPGWFFDPDAQAPAMKPIKVPLGETWSAMEELVSAGLVRQIGICNFNVALLRDLLSYARLRPSVLQVELHPYLVQEKLVRFCRDAEIGVTGFSPLGAQSYHAIQMAKQSESLLEDPVVVEIARQHQRTPAQILLRWGVQRGTAVVPKSSRLERLRENLNVFDFGLSDREMDQVRGLDRHRRFNDPGVFCEHAFNTFFPIYE